MLGGTVAKRYAYALYEIAQEHGRVDEIDNQAQALEHIFDDKQIKDFFTSPRISALQKKQTLEKLLQSRVDPQLLNLCKLLVDKKRIAYLPAIMRAYDILTDEFRGVEEVRIVSAVPLSKEQENAIVKHVERFSQFGGADFRRILEVDSGVIGGVKVILGKRRVFDGTVSSRLHEMRESMYRYRHRGVGA